MNIKEVPFEDLIAQYEPLLKSQIKKFYAYDRYDELYQVALIALWEAQQNYNPAKVYFPSYAKLYVKGKLLNFLKEEQTYINTTQVFAVPEMIENLPAPPEMKQIPFPVERIKPLLKPNELLWFHEFYYYQSEPTAIAKKYHVTIDQVKHWRKQTLNKIRTNFRKSELIEEM